MQPITFLEYCSKNKKSNWIPRVERNVMIFLLRDYNNDIKYQTYIELLTTLRSKKYPQLMIDSFVKLWNRYMIDVC